MSAFDRKRKFNSGVNHVCERRSPRAALGHEPSFTMAQILADGRLLSAVLLPVGDVYPKGTLTAVT
jgi:hypothetical protein